jgi:single-stranded-DNA-specific exonuclease
VLAARGVRDAGELDNSLDRLIPPGKLKGLSEAVELLADAIRCDRRIVIVADFDADGATSCALGMRALPMMGAKHVSFVVPNRFKYGYGLTPEIVKVAAAQMPDVLVTVDNGISSVEGVRAARAMGMDVLVTDHHLPGAELPPATAIVNPNQPGCGFPSKQLAGVGVIFYVMLALRAHLRANGWFDQQNIPEPNLAGLLDLVALGTVADVVPLDFNNRVLVAQGLGRINNGRCSPGVRALLAVARRPLGRITAADLAFGAGPRLNAAGRLEDMSAGIACLLAANDTEAARLAKQLDDLNRERREIEAGMQDQARAIVAQLHLDGGLPRGLCLFNAEWHQGVIGIVAGRIKDQLHRPVIAFARADDGEIKGSARSVNGVHIRDCLDAIAARHPLMLQKFGGHAMAAGLTLREEAFEAFATAFADEVSRHLSEDDLRSELITDGEIPARDLTLDFAELLRASGPWGQSFTEPMFDGSFEVLHARIVGERHLKLNLRHAEGRTVEAIAFNHSQEPPAAGSWVHAAFRVDANEYQGIRRVQLVIEQLSPATAPGDGVQAAAVGMMPA